MSIPVVNFSHYTSGSKAQRADFIEMLGRALTEYGFVEVNDHTVDLELLAKAYDVAKGAFDLPRAIKLNYERTESGRQRGYTALGVEHAKHTNIADIKEFWQIGRTLDPKHPLSQSETVEANLFPAELPSFGNTFRELFSQMELFANQLLEAIGEYLKLETDFFQHMVQDGNSVLRVIHYPPLTAENAPGAVRAAEHEDINLITVLPASTESGLEVLTRQGQWMPITSPPGVMICDTGDMMSLLTQGRLPATTHRVVNPRQGPSNQSRLSMPFFVHPKPDQVLNPFDPTAEPIRAIEVLNKRLHEIGVTKP
jgi:isopenicillin N synthase-like dioxygenase